MGEVVKLEDPTNFRRVAERVKKLWNEGTVKVLGHATKRMRERGFDLHDVGRTIKEGTITDYNEEGGNGRWAMEGKALDERSIRLILEISGLLLIVTVIEL